MKKKTSLKILTVCKLFLNRFCNLFMQIDICFGIKIYLCMKVLKLFMKVSFAYFYQKKTTNNYLDHKRVCVQPPF